MLFNEGPIDSFSLGGPVGKWTFPVIRDLVRPEDVITVSDAEMFEGVNLAAERLKVVAELPAGAGIAAAIKAKKRFPELRRIGVILCGGNVSLDALSKMVAEKN